MSELVQSVQSVFTVASTTISSLAAFVSGGEEDINRVDITVVDWVYWASMNECLGLFLNCLNILFI